MQAVISNHTIMDQLKNHSRSIVTDWLRGSTIDSRLQNDGHLPDRKIVACVRDIVEFLIETVAEHTSCTVDAISRHAERYARELWSHGYSPCQMVLEMGHLRLAVNAALHECDDCREKKDIEEHLNVIMDVLLAEIVSVYVEVQNAAGEAERVAAEAEVSNRTLILEVVGHEMRSPLTPIFTWIDMLSNNIKAASPDVRLVEQACQGIKRSARTLKRLIDDLNDYNALTKGKLSINKVMIDARVLVEDCFDLIIPRASTAKITVRHELPDYPVMVNADEMRIQQCILNLLNNAVKFTPEQGAITLSLRATSDRAFIEVRDTGAGIARNQLGLLFVPFQQLDPMAKAGGLGLGLAVVKSITELHGGTVSAESSGRGHGSVFKIELARVNAEPVIK
jgi:signal transduction histidine kinase